MTTPGTDKRPKKSWNPRTEPITEFGRWFAQCGKTPKDLIDELGCSRGYAYDIIRGSRTPSLENAAKIIKWSRGMRCRQVQVEDFLPDAKL